MLVTAGGWCAPSEAIFNLDHVPPFDWEYVDWTHVVDCYNNGYSVKPLPPKWWEALPEITMSRGPIEWNFDLEDEPIRRKSWRFWR